MNMGKIICRFRRHNWGEWQYKTEGSCSRHRICKRCGAIEDDNYIFHDWGEWEYKGAGSCIQDMHCKRCGTVYYTTNEKHDLSEWQYLTGDSCEQVTTCKRCKKTQNRIQHVWEDKEYVVDGSVKKYKVCRRCAGGPAADEIIIQFEKEIKDSSLPFEQLKDALELKSQGYDLKFELVREPIYEQPEICDKCKANDSYPEGSCWGSCECHNQPPVHVRDIDHIKVSKV
ncbi:MAG: hypothetical protein Q8920_13430 [Bacillota bacterium]|nr:hypothetical protein [Bacillota bacterium]